MIDIDTSLQINLKPIDMLSKGAPDLHLQTAIAVHGVGKMYRIYNTPQDRLKQMLWRGRRQYGRDFWALRDVSLDVRQGESVGILGKNGSGKSTLLQIIAGTLAPTTGSVHIKGRVSALLELGSGFNPEFTGRENVFLNGTILGISLEEMRARFDDIASFADIGTFIDQPVKTYSSGMLMRLAFAVASSIEPDILIVDEALSVGDAYFQHKCMRRIKQLVDNGTALLFVSHGTDIIKRFCERGLWLDNSNMRYYGSAGVAVEKYLASMRMEALSDTSMVLDTVSVDDIEQFNVNNNTDDIERVAIQPKADFTSNGEQPDGLGLVSRAQEVEAKKIFSLARIHITHDIDLHEEQLFPRGQWHLKDFHNSSLLLRSTSDLNALAVFSCSGSHISLSFLTGANASSIHVTIDGHQKVLDLFNPNERRIETFAFDVFPGTHVVSIQPASQAREQAKQLYWLGGRVDSPAPLTFMRDPHLYSLYNEVERYGTGKAGITAVRLLDAVTREPVKEIAFGQRVCLQIHAERLKPAGPRLEFSYIIRDRNRIDLFGTTTIDEGIRLDPLATTFVVEFAFSVRLGAGSYSILVAFVECSEDLQKRVPMDQIDIAYTFSVLFNPARPVWYVFYEPVTIQATVDEHAL